MSLTQVQKEMLALNVQESLVPVGTVFPFSGDLTPPNGYLFCDGSLIGRNTFASLFSIITISFNNVDTNGTTTLTIVGQDPTTLGVVSGMPISGTNIPPAATVSSVTSSTIVISLPATGTTTGGTAVVCPYGVGDGSTTFNVPDMRGIFIRGAGTQTFGAKTYTGTRGIKQNDTFESHTHSGTTDNRNRSAWLSFTGTSPSDDSGNGVLEVSGVYALDFNHNHTFTTNAAGSGAETYPANLSINYIIKY